MENKKIIKRAIPKPTKFGKNLKFFRRLKGLSQAALAKELDVNRNRIASYESGVVEPNTTIFLAICNYLERSPFEMLSTDPDTLLEDVSSTNSDLQIESIEEQLGNMIYETNEISKIFAAFKTKSEDNLNYDKSDMGELNASYQDLLELMELLLKSNWDFLSACNIEVDKPL